jgi:hypothetical protein
MSIDQAITYLETLKSNNIYAVIGKADSWGQLDAPPAQEASVFNLNDSISAIYAMKVLPQRMTLACARYTWEERVFDQYNENIDMTGKMFYCITSAGLVYKCIENASGAVSTVEPSATIPGPFQTADGYIWCLVAVVPEPTELLFNNSAFIPIKTLTGSEAGYELQYASQIAAVPGTIDRINIIQGGLKYSDAAHVEIVGDGFGAGASLTRHPITGTITDVSMLNHGRGYTYAQVVVVDPSPIGGEDAILTASVCPIAGGNGSDPVLELGAKNILCSVDLATDESGALPHDFDFRSFVLYANPAVRENLPLVFSPNRGKIFINPNQDITVKIRSFVQETDSIMLVYNDPDVPEAFQVFANSANPYGTEEATITGYGITVSYSDALNQWEINLDASLSAAALIRGSMDFIAEVRDSSNDPIFGNINAPDILNTFGYELHPNTTVSNVPADIDVSYVIDDDRYLMADIATVENVSGLFERSETISFLNGGHAAYIGISGNQMQLSGAINPMTGTIIGESSGASANITAYNGSKKWVPVEPIYRHYFTAVQKNADESVKLTAILSF